MAFSSFFDLPESRRMAIYAAISHLGCDTYSREGSAFGVAVARGTYSDLIDALASHGLDHAELTYFPLGSDQPAERLRHDGRYPGSRGFYMIAWFRPRILHPEVT